MSINKSYYAIIPADVRYDEDLTPNAKLLYGEITALCNEKGYCWATNSYFAELYKVSKTSISKWIKQLIDKGYIVSKIKYKENTKEIDNRFLFISSPPIEEKLNRYLIEVKNPIEEKLNTPIEEKLKENNTLINNTVNTTIKKEKGLTEIDRLIVDYSDNEKLKDTLIEFVKMRKGIKSAITTVGLKRLLKRLDSLADNDDDKIKILDNSIMNSWKGIFPLKKESSMSTKGELKFNNFEAREYDYEDLEKKLLGWDKD